MSAKMGRPTEKPLKHTATIRYDEECQSILQQYCEQENIGRNEAVRRGIKKLKNDIKK